MDSVFRIVRDSYLMVCRVVGLVGAVWLSVSLVLIVLAEQVMVPRSEIHQTPIIPHGARC